MKTKQTLDQASAESEFGAWSERDVHFFSRHVPPLLAQCVDALGQAPALADVGCGDGRLVWALAECGRLRQDSNVVGIDLSPLRVQRFHALTGYPGVVADGDGVSAVKGASVDLALSTMVIEHVPDELAYLGEIARILRPDGMLYLTTVVRKRGAWYFRKAPDGRRVLDPTHLREYASAAEVRRLVEASGFVIRAQRLSRLWFPIAHPLVRARHAWRPIRDVQRYFLSSGRGWLERVALPIPRYREIEIVAERVVAR